MHLEAHAALGWSLGVLWPGSERRMRNCAWACAILPDIDAAPYLVSPEAYMHYHHTFGHNVFLGLAAAGVCGLLVQRGREARVKLLTAGLVLASFGAHLVSDAFFTRFDVHLLWPFSRWGFLIPGGPGLVSPINTWMVYGLLALTLVLAVWKQVSPLEVVSPRLDRIVQNAFRTKERACATCAGPCNERCDSCEQPTCFRHAGLAGWFRVRCQPCNAGAPRGPAPEQP